jgi:hypothetical protein
MSKVEAYRCDVCFTIKTDDETVGITPTEDLFDRMLSFPIENKIERAKVHICVECYKKEVTEAAQRTVNRRKDETAYKAKIKELGYGIRSKAVFNWRNGIFKPEG